ncbi:hypothetical protein [Desulfovibrio subterraneus]|uniref:Uncharacterized protein n=1 Tax=Desulfovibrio subterraneus TaxID=2718620 RepID=A0A7J0BI96_9BACT|nr:hypothetical protein [Desulfovibrio subterraneus]GFM33417.1 hypothetical protein DSM101010T_17820 [Desulfovibrio subterraneus]
MISYLIAYLRTMCFFKVVVLSCISTLALSKTGQNEFYGNIMTLLGILSGSSLACVAIAATVLTNESFINLSIDLNVGKRVYGAYVDSIRNDCLFVFFSLIFVVTFYCIHDVDLPGISMPLSFVTKRDLLMFLTLVLFFSSISALKDVLESIVEIIKLFYEGVCKKRKTCSSNEG